MDKPLISEVVLKDAEKADVPAEVFLKRLSSLQRILVDLLFSASSAKGLRALRQEIIRQFTNAFLWYKWSMERDKTSSYLARNVVVNSVIADFTNQTNMLHPRRILEVGAKIKKAGEGAGEVSPYEIIVKEKIIRIPGHSTIKNALDSLEVQGFVISIQTDTFKTDKLYALAPVFEAYLRRRKYSPKPAKAVVK